MKSGGRSRNGAKSGVLPRAWSGLSGGIERWWGRMNLRSERSGSDWSESHLSERSESR